MPPTNLSCFSMRLVSPPSLLLVTCIIHGLLLGLCGISALLGVQGWAHGWLLVACTAYALGVLGWCGRQGARQPDHGALLRGGPRRSEP